MKFKDLKIGEKFILKKHAQGNWASILLKLADIPYSHPNLNTKPTAITMLALPLEIGAEEEVIRLHEKND